MRTGFQGNVTTFQPSEKGVELDIAGCEPGDVATVLNTFLLEHGFKLEKGDPMNGTYGTGSSVGRVIVGGFAKRAKYDVSVGPAEGGNVHASVTSAMSGAGGGVIGVLKERKQRTRFLDDLESYLA
jgi:hypothetical protein